MPRGHGRAPAGRARRRRSWRWPAPGRRAGVARGAPGVTGLPVTGRRSGQAASAGAAAAGRPGGGHRVRPRPRSTRWTTGGAADPAAPVGTPGLWRRAPRVAAAVIDLAGSAGPGRGASGPGRSGRGVPVRLMLAYGTSGLAVEVPDDAVVVEPVEPPALADEAGAIRQALREPGLRAAAGRTGPWRPAGWRWSSPTSPAPCPTPPCSRPCWTSSSRPAPGRSASSSSAPPAPTARPPRPRCRTWSVPDIMDRYRIHDHDSDDRSHVEVGEVDGTPVLLDRRYVEADVRIVTGFVEPHFFAGWSGGPKGVCPGLAGTETILEAHSPARLADARSSWMITEGNPVHDFVAAATALCPPDLSVDVTIDSRRHLTGRLRRAPSRAGTGPPAPSPPTPSPRRWTGRFDVVVTTNGGHPLDRNLYQAVKGMAAAERVVAPGGIIILAAACGDGVPADGAFARIVAASVERRGADPSPGPGPARRLAGPGARAGPRARRGLDPRRGPDRRRGRPGPADPGPRPERRGGGSARPWGPGARLCVLPHGPLTVATATGPAIGKDPARASQGRSRR